MAIKLMVLTFLQFIILIISGDCKDTIRKLTNPENSHGALDKSVAKTIQTEHGDIYDCVDFYEQPSLKHPSLRNHNFHPQMRPSSSPKRMGNSEFAGQVKELDIRLKDGGCPIGTVPIRRIGKDELAEFNLMKRNFNSSTPKPNSVYERPGTILALAQTQNGPSTKLYNGVGAHISVYNPSVRLGEYSSGELILQNGPDMIEVGWTVNPSVYKDKATRLFVYTTAGNTHCFNSHCGFVIVDKEMPMDATLGPVSTVGGEIYLYQYFIYQDEKNGNWWLELGKNSTIVGFWPQQFFSGLSHSASYFACGGEVYRAPGSTGQPEMGSGNRAYWHDITKEAFCRNFVMVNDAHQVVQATGTEEFQNDDKDYWVIDNPVRERPDHYVFFGGPGWADE